MVAPVRSAGGSVALYLARRHNHTSSIAGASQLNPGKQQLLASAPPASVPDATDEAHTQPAVPAAAAVAAAASPRLLPPRVKGIGRKMLLRQFNRTVVRRIARRATIGVPVLGLYFVVRILRRDAANLREAAAAGDPRLRALFAVAVATELADLGAQLAITAGTGLTLGLLPPHLVGLLGLSALPALLPLADKVSLVCAAVSCCAGLFAEGIKADKAVRGQDSTGNTPTA